MGTAPETGTTTVPTTMAVTATTTAQTVAAIALTLAPNNATLILLGPSINAQK
jgi:hypothetical protein